MRMITDPTDREGLTSGTLADWIETLAMAPLLAVAVCAVVALAAWSIRHQSPRPAAAAAADRSRAKST